LPFGTRVAALIIKKKRETGKLGHKAVHGRWIGYDDTSNTHLVLIDGRDGSVGRKPLPVLFIKADLSRHGLGSFSNPPYIDADDEEQYDISQVPDDVIQTHLGFRPSQAEEKEQSNLLPRHMPIPVAPLPLPALPPPQAQPESPESTNEMNENKLPLSPPHSPEDIPSEQEMKEASSMPNSEADARPTVDPAQQDVHHDIEEKDEEDKKAETVSDKTTSAEAIPAEEPLRRSTRTRYPNQKLDDYGAYGSHLNFIVAGADATTIEEMELDQVDNNDDEGDTPKIWHVGDREEWRIPIQDEIKQLQDAGTFEEVKEDELTSEQRKHIIDSTFTLRKKRDEKGVIQRYKARLVARGDQLDRSQLPDTHAPTPRTCTMRFVFFLIACQNLFVYQGDVKNAFVRAYLQEPVFIRPCKWARMPVGVLWRCIRSLYGLPQASRNWFLLLRKSLMQFGMSQSTADVCLFFRNGLSLLVLFHVDDLLLVGQENKVRELVAYLQQLFPMTGGETIKQYCGAAIQITRDSLSISCPAFIRACAAKFGVTALKPVSTPIVSILTQRTAKEPQADVKRMQGITGCLLWIVRLCRPDANFAVHELSKFAANPAKRHIEAAERVLNYLFHTADYGIRIRRHTQIKLQIYVDSDYYRNGDRKPTGGLITFIGNAPVDWFCRSQTRVATSTFAAELHAAAKAVEEARYWQSALDELQARIKEPTPIHEDNQAVVNFANRNNANDEVKHLTSEYFFVKESVDQGVTRLIKVAGTMNVADLLTKPLQRQRFEYLRSLLGIVDTSLPDDPMPTNVFIARGCSAFVPGQNRKRTKRIKRARP
jgi:hypothetical protein